ncbi:MAG: NAD(+)/NADH kinase [Planctomycetes bacterium]|nr:NAD(+)/NADH kinase [Planctomycetota bacterium]
MRADNREDAVVRKEVHKRFAILSNPDKPQALRAGEELAAWLSERAEVIANESCDGFDPAVMAECDFVVVLGGDGTILSTVRKLGQCQKPLIGVNMGKLGFLAEFSVEQLKVHFERIVSDDSLVSRRTMLSCRITGPGREEFQSIAVNEVAVIAGPPFRMIEVSVSVDGEHLANCRGDGLIVATPNGSTAYNLSAGGPLLDPDLGAVVITPLAAHSLSFRPIVVHMDKPISIRCPDCHKGREVGSNEPTAMVVIDGQDNVPVSKSDEVVIRKVEDCFFQLVRNPEQGQWQLLNTKLHWGATLT